MTLEEHKNEVKKLNKLEVELINLITESEVTDLMVKFMDWQNQREICNDGFYDVLNNLDKK